MAKFNFVWEEIPTKESRTKDPEPAAILSGAAIKLNSAATIQFGTPERIVLALDEKNKVIAIKEYQGEENLKAYDFQGKLKARGVTLRCKNFMTNVQTKMNIDLTQGKAVCPAHYDSKMGMLIIQVSTTHIEEVEEAKN